RAAAPSAPPRPIAADPTALQEAAALLQQAERPLILAGRVGRGEAEWQRRLKLAETLGAVALTDPKTGATFPSTHPLQGPPAGNQPSDAACELIRAADVVLSLDWVDLAGILKTAWGAEAVGNKVISASLDHLVHNGWRMDYQGLAPGDLHLPVLPHNAGEALLPLLQARSPGWPDRKPTPRPEL